MSPKQQAFILPLNMVLTQIFIIYKLKLTKHNVNLYLNKHNTFTISGVYR